MSPFLKSLTKRNSEKGAGKEERIKEEREKKQKGIKRRSQTDGEAKKDDVSLMIDQEMERERK